MRLQTIDSARSDILEQILRLCEGATVRMDLAAGGGHLPDFYDPDAIYEVRKTNISHNYAGLEQYFTVFLNRPDEPRTADPLFKITVSRNVPANRRFPIPDNPEWTRHWVGHKNYDKFGSWSGTGHHKIQSLTVVDEPPRCEQCGAISHSTKGS